MTDIEARTLERRGAGRRGAAVNTKKGRTMNRADWEQEQRDGVEQAKIDHEATIARLRRAVAVAQAKSTKAMNVRQRLPAGSSRARVTTANANWANAAEARDRAQAALEAAEAKS